MLLSYGFLRKSLVPAEYVECGTDNRVADVEVFHPRLLVEHVVNDAAVDIFVQ